MDTSDPEIKFNEEGFCNHCTNALIRAKEMWFPNEEGSHKLNAIFTKIKRDGKRKEYDCIIGLSGGVDSSYLAYMAVKNGLRPLIVHIDCGWNSELAVKNIENIVKLLNLELHTHVVDWEEMKNLQLAFLKAGVANQDVPQDHAIFAGLYSFAAKHNVRYVFTGTNFATESILPPAWGYNALDFKLINDINHKFGKSKLKRYPYITFFKRYIYFQFFLGMKIIQPLNLISYDRDKVIKLMDEELGWRYYGGKHHESRFTKFFQTYYLPVRFGYDKRLAHLSSMIISGLISRDMALTEMNKPLYDNLEIVADKEYIAKKLDISTEDLDNFISLPKKSYRDYKSNEKWFKLGFKVRNYLRNLK